MSLVAAGLVAAVIISFFSIDLGRVPGLKALVEREASKYLERPMRIGSIRALVWPGQFALDNIEIEGRTADARPFFTAKRLTLHFPWWTLFRREIVAEVTLDGWHMVVETWANGLHNIPKLTPKDTGRPPGKRPPTTVNFVYANSGHFSYYDHVTPWTVVAPNLSFELVRAFNLKAYVGRARFDGGTVGIQNFLPMHAKMSTRFMLDGPVVRLQHLDLITDGAESHITGTVGFGKLWPEQQYNINSTLDFPRMRQIFFANENWQLAGEGRFKGIFRLFKGGGYNMSGDFGSDEFRFDRWRFPDLHGSLEWVPGRFAVTHADSRFEGGNMRLAYALRRPGVGQGYIADLNADYDGVDLHAFTRKFDWDALQPDGRLRGRLAMTWPNGKFKTALTGEGASVITPPEGARTADAKLSATAPAGVVPTQADADVPMGRIPLAGEMTYRFDAGALEFADSWAATPRTFTTFTGKALGGPAKMTFHVTSHDWQESDRLFVAILNQFSANPTSAIPVSGRGTFDGTLTESFRSPRIVGRFDGDTMAAWAVVWGRAGGDLAIENGFMDIANGVISNGAGGTIRTSGRYALGFRGGEEMKARVTVDAWPLADFRQAFGLNDWPAEGTVALADLDLRGPYLELTGAGPLRIENGTAWREPFERATGNLVFEGRSGLRIRNIVMTKGPGQIDGEAFIDWHNGTYVFRAEGRSLPVEQLANFQFDLAPLTGRLAFKARGDGAFANPAYELDGTIADLYVGDEGVGEVVARLVVRDETLTIDRLDAASGRLQATGSGSIALNEHYDARLFLRFFNTSLDPYLRLVAPVKVSEFTRAIVSGSISVIGPLANRADLVVTAEVNDAALTLFDYTLTNGCPAPSEAKGCPIRFAFEDNVFKVVQLALTGENTKLTVSGQVDSANRQISLDANGQANLAIIQLFYPGVSADGAATLRATLEGPFGGASLSGSAQIKGGRLKPHGFTHGFSDINGPITVTANRISVDGLTGAIGEGPVTFGGSITLDNEYQILRYGLEANGQSMHLRAPRGVLSTVYADLKLTGPASAPVLSGDVDVLTASYRPPIEAVTDIFALAAGGAGESLPAAPPAPSGIPIAYDINVHAPVMPFIENKQAKIEGSASAHIGGTFDRPSITGWVDIERGFANILGNRYTIRSGSRIEFTDPSKLDPFFSVEADTRVRVQGQTYNVNVRVAGTLDKLAPTFSAEPWLPDFQVMSLLLGESPDVGDAEVRNQQSKQDLQAQALRSAGATLLTAAISSRVGGVLQNNPLIDSIQLTPLLNEASLQQLSPTGRVTLTRRISNQMFLTYARTFSASEQEVIRIEYDQSDQVTWVLSRNEDRTFSLDFRIRRVF